MHAPLIKLAFFASVLFFILIIIFFILYSKNDSEKKEEDKKDNIVKKMTKSQRENFCQSSFCGFNSSDTKEEIETVQELPLPPMKGIDIACIICGLFTTVVSAGNYFIDLFFN